MRTIVRAFITGRYSKSRPYIAFRYSDDTMEYVYLGEWDTLPYTLEQRMRFAMNNRHILLDKYQGLRENDIQEYTVRMVAN